MTAPIEESYPIEKESPLVLFRVISRRSWDELQSWHEALPGSRVEHLMYGFYVLHVRPGGARELSR